jgi:pyridoxine 5-phosphate synthase
MPRLGLNIDHIATLRQARRISYPDPVASMDILVAQGVDQVTCHLREDRRHIQDHDLSRLLADGRLPVNLEMAPTTEMIAIAAREKPRTVTLVPEKREEITTEGGLDLRQHRTLDLAPLPSQGIRISFFIDPDREQVDLASQLGAQAIELHTGTFCEAFGTTNENREWQRLKDAAVYAKSAGLDVYAGHGLNLDNVSRVVSIAEIEEYNIGHSIIARAVFVGLAAAIREIKELLR